MNDPRRVWGLRGAGAGALLGAALLTFLVFAAGERVAPWRFAEAALAWGGLVGMSALLGAWLGWLHGVHLAQPLPTTAWDVMKREGAAGLRMGLAFGLLYTVAALGFFLGPGPPMPLWLLALRAGLALAVSTLGVGAIGFFIGLLKARSA